MKKLFKNGISIRAIHIAMLICAAAIVVLLVVSTTKSSGVFTTLSAETENYIVRQKAAHDLMEASDYLTENVQRFTLDGDIKYLNQYFEEAFTSQRRENAVQSMSENHADASLVRQLEEALNESKSLMAKEKQAMCLVCDLLNIDTKYMSELEPYRISSIDDVRGNPEGKLKQAQELVMGNDYYASKEIIRTKLKNALEMMDDEMAATRRKTSADMMKDLTANRVIIIVLVVVLAALILLTATQSTIPIMNASRNVRNKERIPAAGSKELRELTDSYNEMLDQLRPSPEEEK